MNKNSLSFEFALVGFLLPVMKSIDHALDNFSPTTLKQIILCLSAGLFITYVFKRTETRSNPVSVAGISFPPWLPPAFGCLFVTIFLMLL